MSGEDLDAQRLHQALHITEHVFHTMMTGNLVSNRYGLLLPQGTCGTAVPQHPRPEEVLRVQNETDLHVSAGPEEDFEPDWGVGPGTTALVLPVIAAEPVDHGTVEVRHRLTHGARLGIDIGGVRPRIGGSRT